MSDCDGDAGPFGYLNVFGRRVWKGDALILKLIDYRLHHFVDVLQGLHHGYTA